MSENLQISLISFVNSPNLVALTQLVLQKKRFYLLKQKMQLKMDWFTFNLFSILCYTTSVLPFHKLGLIIQLKKLFLKNQHLFWYWILGFVLRKKVQYLIRPETNKKPDLPMLTFSHAD